MTYETCLLVCSSVLCPDLPVRANWLGVDDCSDLEVAVKRDSFVTREDGRNAARGVVYSLLIVGPFWIAVLYFWLR